MNRKNIKLFLIPAILFAVFLGFGFVFNSAFSEVSASDTKTVTKITRVTHPAYTMANSWQGEQFGGPWNRDYTRIMIYENGSWYENPNYPGAIGRKAVWGFVSTLKQLGGGLEYQGTLAQYQAATYQLPLTYAYIPVWSVFGGEENIVYALKTTTKQLVKYNVDTLAETVITFYDHEGSTFPNPQIVGWTPDNTLLILFAGATTWGTDGYEINVQTAAKTYFTHRPGYCEAEGERWPHMGIHGGRSLDKKWIAEYHASSLASGVYQSDYTTYCYPYVYLDPPQYVDSYGGGNLQLTHVMWDISDDWFVAGSLSKSTAPHIALYRIVQVFFNRDTHAFSHNVLLEFPSAGFWYPSPSPYGNYHGLPTPTMRKDGNQLMFMSTNGKYSLEDYKYNNSYTPWQTRGMFLADLTTTQITDTTPPASPTGLTVN